MTKTYFFIEHAIEYYINDIVNNINAKVRPFADDTSLYIIVDTPIAAVATRNNDLDTIFNWFKTWLVSFNPSKTGSMIFSKKSEKAQSSNSIYEYYCY